MSLYVQAAPNNDGESFHIQVTGPSFPLGYASGDAELMLDDDDRKCFIPSMRGSGRLYFQLTEGEIIENLVEIMTCLHAPRPQYSASDVAEVAKRVQESLYIADHPPVEQSTSEVDEGLVSRIVAAVLAALKK